MITAAGAFLPSRQSKCAGPESKDSYQAESHSRASGNLSNVWWPHRGSKAVADAVLASFKNTLLDSADPHTRFHKAKLLHTARRANAVRVQNPRLLKQLSIKSQCQAPAATTGPSLAGVYKLQNGQRDAGFTVVVLQYSLA